MGQPENLSTIMEKIKNESGQLYSLKKNTEEFNFIFFFLMRLQTTHFANITLFSVLNFSICNRKIYYAYPSFS